MNLKQLERTPPWDWPDSAGALLIRVLLDRAQPLDDRLVAAQLAGDCTVVNDDIADGLLSILESSEEPETLRSKAAISLGPALELVDTMGPDDPDSPMTTTKFDYVQERLASMFGDDTLPPDLRRSLLEASVRAPQPWHRDAIESALSSDDRRWRTTAVWCMQYVAGFADRILESLDSDDAAVQQFAAQAAGNWEVDTAWKPLRSLVETSEDTEVRVAALEALASIRPEHAESILVELTQDSDPIVAQAAEDALASLDGPVTGRMSIPDDLLN